VTHTTGGYAGSRETTEGRVYTVTGGDWDELLASDPFQEERIVLNLGPQHPSTHGVLRLVLELEGETVTSTRMVIGYLHTGIEKNTEFRNWTQGTTFVTRADYLAPIFNETAYCMGIERLLGIEAPRRAQVIRTLLMEVNRCASHWVALATGGMELGALTGMTNGFRARERCLDMLELVTGLRMNHAFVRPGGLAQDLPHETPVGVPVADHRPSSDGPGTTARRRATARWIRDFTVPSLTPSTLAISSWGRSSWYARNRTARWSRLRARSARSRSIRSSAPESGAPASPSTRSVSRCERHHRVRIVARHWLRTIFRNQARALPSSRSVANARHALTAASWTASSAAWRSRSTAQARSYPGWSSGSTTRSNEASSWAATAWTSDCCAVIGAAPLMEGSRLTDAGNAAAGSIAAAPT